MAYQDYGGFLEKGTGVDEVVVMLKILSNSFGSKLCRHRANQEMWMSFKDWMLIRNVL